MTTHQPMTLYTGPPDCIDRQCAEYATGATYCSHLLAEQACAACSTERLGTDAEYEHVVPWPCPTHRSAHRGVR